MATDGAGGELARTTLTRHDGIVLQPQHPEGRRRRIRSSRSFILGCWLVQGQPGILETLSLKKKIQFSKNVDICMHISVMV